jgi:hypothetical protein
LVKKKFGKKTVKMTEWQKIKKNSIIDEKIYYGSVRIRHGMENARGG